MDVLANLKPFPRLTALSLHILPLGKVDGSLDVAPYESCAPNFRNLLRIYAQAPLAALSVPGVAATMSQCPERTLRNLTHLALYYTQNLRDVGDVLEHCVRL